MGARQMAGSVLPKEAKKSKATTLPRFCSINAFYIASSVCVIRYHNYS